MAVQRFSANWNERTDLMDQITPNVEYASDYKVIPAGEFKPAPWLPVIWTDERSKDAFVISKGKVVALSTEGHVVPAGLRTKLVADGLVYTARDVSYGVINLTTGEPVAAAVTYTALQVAQALVARGLVLEQNSADTMTAAAVIPVFISMPIGISNCDVYVWAGEEGETTFVNYRKQHLITFMSQCQLVVPQMSADLVSGGNFNAVTLATTVFNASTQPMIDAGQLWNITNLLLLARYSNVLTATSPVVALGLGTEQSIARITDRTPLTSDVTSVSVLLRQRPSPDLITRAGDFYLDAEVGALFISSVTWAALTTAAETDVDFSYYVYPNASPTTATSERNVYFVGEVLPGDCVGVDADSNLTVIPLTTTIDTLDDVRGVIGRVTGVLVEPAGLLDKVKTAWNFVGADSKIQMPGTATKGFSDRITFMNEVVADKLIVVFIDCK